MSHINTDAGNPWSRIPCLEQPHQGALPILPITSTRTAQKFQYPGTLERFWHPNVTLRNKQQGRQLVTMPSVSGPQSMGGPTDIFWVMARWMFHSVFCGSCTVWVCLSGQSLKAQRNKYKLATNETLNERKRRQQSRMPRSSRVKTLQNNTCLKQREVQRHRL